MFNFKRKEKKDENSNVKCEVLEIDYLKENQVLQEIIRVSYNTKDLIAASNKIIQIITRNYKIQYCTLFLFANEKFRVSGTNVGNENIIALEELAEKIYFEKCSGKDADAYVLKSEQPMNYETAWDRGIRYLMFSPLKIDNLIGAMLIENTEVTLTRDEMEFFELIVENVALILQNLIYFKQIVDVADRDGLTGVYNRHYMNAHLENVIEVVKTTNQNFCIAMFDIDHFKKFNDTYGHLHGDKVLKDVSAYVKSKLRVTDVLYRYGGEEFVIYFSNIKKEEAAKLLDDIRLGVSELDIRNDKDEVTKVTASFGLAEFPTHDMSVRGLIEKADKAMYASKNSGRNKVTCYET